MGQMKKYLMRMQERSDECLGADGSDQCDCAICEGIRIAQEEARDEVIRDLDRAAAGVFDDQFNWRPVPYGQAKPFTDEDIEKMAATIRAVWPDPLGR